MPSVLVGLHVHPHEPTGPCRLSSSRAMTSEPDAERARQRYDRMASTYDRSLAPLRRLQDRVRVDAVCSLELEQGDVVLDIGCGTGASLAQLVAAAGPEGRVVAVDQSQGMLDVARQRIADAGWTNVELICAPIQQAELPDADGALLFFTHDLMRSPAALDNVANAVRGGRRIVAAGAKRPPRWLVPVAAIAGLAMRRYVTTLEGISAPWSLLAERVDDLAVTEVALGTIYRATGRVTR